MAELVEEALPPKRVRSQGQRVQHFLDARNVVSIEFVRDAGYDGMIEPIGSTFGDGFKMRLKASASEARARFTLAHEACHTFFYELAPEIKFRHHEEDNREESLCNFGAAVLLIPSAQLRARVKKLPVCLDSLDQMAEEYAVSLPTMLLRLRSLGLWRCQLSLWHRTVGGEFVLDRLYGGPKVEWKWHGPSALEHVWESSESALGTGFVYVTGRGGNQAYKPIVYHVRRSNTGVIVLWGDGIAPKVSACPLFEMARAA
jgi:Zn-dependent peptidase ImmA (M78 family)